MSQSYSRKIEIYWMLIMTAVALIISATFLEGWTSISFLFIASIVYFIAQIFFWWIRLERNTWEELRKRRKIQFDSRYGFEVPDLKQLDKEIKEMKELLKKDKENEGMKQ